MSCLGQRYCGGDPNATTRRISVLETRSVGFVIMKGHLHERDSEDYETSVVGGGSAHRDKNRAASPRLREKTADARAGLSRHQKAELVRWWTAYHGSPPDETISAEEMARDSFWTRLASGQREHRSDMSQLRSNGMLRSSVMVGLFFSMINSLTPSGAS